MMIFDTVVLPQPDSPTRPRVLPRGSARLTPLTAWIVRVRPLNQPARSVKVLQDASAFEDGARSGCGGPAPSVRLRERSALFDLADRRQALVRRHGEARHRAHQRLQIGVLRALRKMSSREPASMTRPRYITDDFVGHVGDDAEVVGDEEHATCPSRPAAR